jgi:SAM-dependent methyltransferase/uncharacterized protein YbaR (Trm112 family)
MRYGLLSYVCCPACRAELACFIAREAPTSISRFVAERAPRAPVPGASFAAAPRFRSSTRLTSRLLALAGEAAPARNREAVVEAGLLLCGECARWFLIVGTLPELLPDHLRDPERETPLFERLAERLPADVRAMLRAPAVDSHSEDEGAHYKRAEIGLASKVDDPHQFFGPGYSAPFNPDNTEFTLYLLSLFGSLVRVLGVHGKSNQGAVAIDSGCGYSWTTEWLAKSGVDAIGIDITRTYLEIAVKRIGESGPHLVVGDVENLPIRECADAVLAFESFHHLPNRSTAMAGYARALREGGVVVLAEPGGAHEDADVSKDTMRKYGILEKGMELEDIEEYIAGLPFAPPEERVVLNVSGGDLRNGIDDSAAWRYSPFQGHIFTVRKDSSLVAPERQGPKPVISDETRARLDAMRQIDAELQRTVAELLTVKAQLHDARIAALDGAQKIEAMRRSAFWRAREIWVKLRGRPGS